MAAKPEVDPLQSAFAYLGSCQTRFIEGGGGRQGLAVNVVVDVAEFVVERGGRNMSERTPLAAFSEDSRAGAK